MAAVATAGGGNFSLPRQEENAMRNATKAHDARDYTKCLRIVDGVLSKYPACCEALSLKALALWGARDKAAEATKGRARDAATAALDEWAKQDPFELAREGIRSHMKSPMAWHSLGMLHRNGRNYAEALKAFKCAQRFEAAIPGVGGAPAAVNQNLLRDASAMAIHLREWDALVEMRQRALAAKSNVRANWVVYAVAQVMAGNEALACGILDVMVQVMEAGDSQTEANEVHLARAELKLQLKQPSEAINVLTKARITDTVGLLLLLGKAHTMSALAAPEGSANRESNVTLARKCYEKLLGLRESERDVLNALGVLEGCHADPLDDGTGGTPPPRENLQFVAVLDRIAEKFPKCDAARRLALDYCAPGVDFEARLAAYCVPFIRNTIPTLFSVLESLYCQPAKVASIAKVFIEWQNKLEAGDHSAFQPGKPAHNPCHVLWVYQLLSVHFKRTGDLARAHEYIDKAIAHTPTIEVLYLAKAEIFEAEGKISEAAEAADTARRLDLQDRYLNARAAQYFLQNGDVETAEDRIQLFLAKSDLRDTHLAQFELQCSWFEIALGRAYLVKQDLISAIAALLLVEKQHETNHDELIDFHNYALRRCNIRQWLDVIRTEDASASTRFRLEAAEWLVRAYIAAADEAGGLDAIRTRHVPRPPITAPTPEEQSRIDKLTESFVLPLSALHLDRPLEQAEKYAATLRAHKPNAPTSQALSFEVDIRAGRLLRCAAAIARLQHIAATNRAVVAPETIAQLQRRLDDAVAARGAQLDTRVKALIAAACPRAA